MLPHYFTLYNRLRVAGKLRENWSEKIKKVIVVVSSNERLLPKKNILLRSLCKMRCNISQLNLWSKSRTRFEHPTKVFAKVGKYMGGAKSQLRSVKAKPPGFTANSGSTPAAEGCPLILGEYLQAVGRRKHASTPQLGTSVTPLPHKALCLSRIAAKFIFTVLKWPGFSTSRTFTLIIN